MKRYKYRYLHIMPQGSMVFDLALINVMNSSEKFKNNEHYFITYSKTLYEHVNTFSNVKYCPKTIHQDFDAFKGLVKDAKHVIMHSNILTLSELIKLGRPSLKKMIWCVWGHDLYDISSIINSDTSPSMLKRFKTVVKKGLKLIRDNYLKTLKGICISFEHDSKEVRRRFGDKIEIYNAAYFFNKQNIEYYDKIKKNSTKDSESCNLMIGHSAFRFLDHINILDKLTKFKKDDIKIFLVMSYGDMEYAKEVYEYALSIYGDKVVLIDKFMNQNEYTRFLSTIDIAIFNQLHQTALANIFMLMYFDATLYLNPKGMIAKSLKDEECYFEYTDKLEQQSFEELVKDKKMFERNNEMVMKYLDYDIKIEKWKELFESLDWQTSYSGIKTVNML